MSMLYQLVFDLVYNLLRVHACLNYPQISFFRLDIIKEFLFQQHIKNRLFILHI
jgi:hypothetical protein